MFDHLRKKAKSRRSAVGSALRSGANHRIEICKICKSLNALKNLTISSVQLNQKIPKWVVWPHVWPLTNRAESRRSAVGSALRSGRKGRGFESRRLDQKMQEIAWISCIFYLFFNSPFFADCVPNFVQSTATHHKTYSLAHLLQINIQQPFD